MDRISAVVAGAATICGVCSLVDWRRKSIPLTEGVGIPLSAVSIRDFAYGVSASSLTIGGVFVTEWGLGLIEIEEIKPVSAKILPLAGRLLGLSAVEEVLYQGVILNGFLVLCRRPMVAQGLTAVVFAIAHSTNPHASAMSVASNLIDGLIFSMAYLRSRRLWYPMGLHFGWNLFQGPIFGFPVSGFDFGGIIKHRDLERSSGLTGAGYGPEAGFIGLFFRLLLMLVLVRSWPAGARTENHEGASNANPSLRGR